MRKRFTFKCWNCGRNYQLFKEITSQQTLIIACPFCGEEAVVKLEPFRKETKSVLRGDDEEEQTIGSEYQFPDVIPTQKPE